MQYGRAQPRGLTHARFLYPPERFDDCDVRLQNDDTARRARQQIPAQL